MTERNIGITLIVVSIAGNFVAKLPRFRNTWLNAALIGASLVVGIFGIYKLWRSRAGAGVA